MSKEKTHFTDRIGEDTAPADCAICYAVSCFSCVHGYCTALEKYAVGGCSFYKDESENRKEIRKCFFRLIAGERFDLLYKYADTMATLGLMDDELRQSEGQRKRLNAYRDAHFAALIDSQWKDTLKTVAPSDNEEGDSEAGGEASEPETQEPEYKPEENFDNSIDQVMFQDGMTDETIDAETAEEIDTRDCFLMHEIQDALFNPTAIAEDIRKQQMPIFQESDELPQDYLEDFDGSIPETYSEWIDQKEEKEQNAEAERERAGGAAECEREKADSGDTEYITVPVNFLFRRIGYPIRRKQPPDPVIQGYGNLGAGIVYKAAEDYIDTLRMLWNGDSGAYDLPRLIIRKWELETFIGSTPYSLYTNINPERILDQCARTAMDREKAKAERINRRVAAGIEGGDGA